MGRAKGELYEFVSIPADDMVTASMLLSHPISLMSAVHCMLACGHSQHLHVATTPPSHPGPLSLSLLRCIGHLWFYRFLFQTGKHGTGYYRDPAAAKADAATSAEGGNDSFAANLRKSMGGASGEKKKTKKGSKKKGTGAGAASMAKPVCVISQDPAKNTLAYVIELPGVSTMKDVDLQVSESAVRVCVPGRFLLSERFPSPQGATASGSNVWDTAGLKVSARAALRAIVLCLGRRVPLVTPLPPFITESRFVLPTTHHSPTTSALSCVNWQ